MSLNLPSFAQAFPHLPQTSNALPPIQMLPKKRVHDEPEVKQEDPAPDDSDDHSPAPSQATHSPVKKRRVTVSGSAPQPPLRIDVRPTQDQSTNTPISPVVMGFTIQRGDPEAFEQLRSSMTVKQKQKALIEQRRGSGGGPPSPTTAAGPEPRAPSKPQHPIPAPLPPSQQPSQQPQAPSRSNRRSPNSMAATNGPPTPAQPTRRATNQRAPSPQPPPQPQQSQQPQSSSHSLPPPPISFARRRAAQFGVKKKPADILISPREREHDAGHPTIQSAPPSQTTFFTGRFPMSMSLPRLPQIVPSSERRPTGNVPPTPTRLSGLQAQSQSQSQSALGSARSPPAASVPIASTLVPPTPTSLHRPGYSGDKAAFLAPFEIFYDALNDSKQMKQWLNEQLQRSNTLMQSLNQQQDRLNETVDSLVEKRTAAMKTEMLNLRKRVDELEDLVRSQNTMPSGAQPMKAPVPLLQNGSAPEPYTFPPVSDPDATRRRAPSPNRERERDRRLTPDFHANTASPVPFDARRMSTSATRLDPPPQSSNRSGSQQSPPLAYRERERERERGMGSHGSGPTMTRQNSTNDAKDKDRGREKEEGRSTPASSSSRRPAGSRRNSIVMAPPESEAS